MTSRALGVLGCTLAAGSLAIAGEPVNLSREVTTQLGQSIFVTGPLPMLGNGDVTRAVKLSPHAYPNWQLAIELPPGVSFTPTFLRRADAPGELSNATNAEVLPAGSAITVPDRSAPPIPVRYFPTGDPENVVLRILSGEPGFTPFDVTMTRHEPDGEPVYWEGAVPADNAWRQRSFRIDTSDGSFPPSGAPIRLFPRPVWIRHDQAFLHDPAALESAPAAPRVETFTFQLTGFPSRTIRVLLPRGYDDSDRAYPVLYAQDGNNVFSPGGAFGSWDLDLTITTLVRRGEIPEIILVGIDNTASRFAEYTPEYGNVMGTPGRGDEFLTRLRDELLPEINSRYRTKPGSEHTAHVGSSLGGILGIHCARHHKATWGTVAALSPSVWVAPDNFRAMAADPPADWARLHIDSGTSGGTNDDFWNTIGLRDKFLESGHVLGHRLSHTIGLDQSHNEAAWRARMPAILRWMYEPAGDDPVADGWQVSASAIASIPVGE